MLASPAGSTRRVVLEKRFLPVPLTLTEKLEMGDSLVKLLGEASDIEAELAQDKLRAKEQLGLNEGKRNDVVHMLRRGSVDREIEVEIELDFQAGKVSYTRRDTGEVYHERPMTYDERQTALKLA